VGVSVYRGRDFKGCRGIEVTPSFSYHTSFLRKCPFTFSGHLSAAFISLPNRVLGRTLTVQRLQVHLLRRLIPIPTRRLLHPRAYSLGQPQSDQPGRATTSGPGPACTCGLGRARPLKSQYVLDSRVRIAKSAQLIESSHARQSARRFRFPILPHPSACNGRPQE
jgi:hypothetical protein